MQDPNQGDNVTPQDHQPMADQGSSADQSMTEKQTQPDTVKYESYRKVVGQNKRYTTENQELRDKVQQYELQEKQRHEAELEQQNKYKELLELKERELAEHRDKAASLEKQQTDARKLNAVLNALPGKVASDYWQLIDLDKVIVNPETGQVEDVSVQGVAKEFNERHSRLIDLPASQAKVDNRAPIPNGSSGTLTRDEWLKLSAADKKKRYHELEDRSDWMSTGTPNRGSQFHGQG